MTVLPSILLSGYISPRENLPGPLYILSELLPVTHLIQICRAIAVPGRGPVWDVMPSVLALIAIATVLIVASTS